jgi:hypothetical protein
MLSPSHSNSLIRVARAGHLADRLFQLSGFLSELEVHITPVGVPYLDNALGVFLFSGEFGMPSSIGMPNSSRNKKRRNGLAEREIPI